MIDDDPRPIPRLTCDRCGVDCTDNPFLCVHNDSSADGPVCQRCATILNGAAK